MNRSDIFNKKPSIYAVLKRFKMIFAHLEPKQCGKECFGLTAKNYLKKLQRLDVLINQKIKEAADLRRTSIKTGSFDCSRERVQTSPSGDAPYVNIIARMSDLEKEIDAEVDRFVDEKHKIINQIQELKDERHIQVLYMRYVEFKTLEQCAVELDLSYRQITRIHGEALQEFEKCHINVLKCHLNVLYDK